MERIQSQIIPENRPSLQDWLKEFNKPIISGTNLNDVKQGGSIELEKEIMQ